MRINSLGRATVVQRACRFPAPSAKFRDRPLATPVERGPFGSAGFCAALIFFFFLVDRGLQVLVTENAAHELVIGRVFLQDERRGQVAKLMRRHPDADLFGDAVDDLTAQGSLGLMPIRTRRERARGWLLQPSRIVGLGVVLHHGIGPISLPRVRRLLGSFPTALCPAQRRWPRALPAAPRDAPILQGKRPRLVPSAVVLPRT